MLCPDDAYVFHVEDVLFDGLKLVADRGLQWWQLMNAWIRLMEGARVAADGSGDGKLGAGR